MALSASVCASAPLCLCHCLFQFCTIAVAAASVMDFEVNAEMADTSINFTDGSRISFGSQNSSQMVHHVAKCAVCNCGRCGVADRCVPTNQTALCTNALLFLK